MSKSVDNLREAFAGESQANRKYLAFAQKAQQEGFPQVAKLFRAAAEAETVHAMNHARVMGEVKTTAENLAASVEGETHEFNEMYPGFIATANKEGNAQAAWSFDMANKVEKVHAGLFSKAAEAIKSGRDAPKTEYYICAVCGNTVEGEAPDRCPICGAPRAKFARVQ